MHRQRRAHDVERVAEAASLGVEVGKQAQRLDLGLVPTPDGGEGLQRGDGRRARHLAEHALEHQRTQAPLRGRGPVPRIGGGLVRAQRIVDAAEPFG